MAQRLLLHSLLKELMGGGKVYFQPPQNVQMEYPCILYHQDNADTRFADNNPYRYTKRYQVTVIDENPDSPIPDLIANLPMCTFDRWYAAENLNHYVFNIFF